MTTVWAVHKTQVVINFEAIIQNRQSKHGSLFRIVLNYYLRV